ncbi:DNA binding protein [Vibrio phage Ceto]|uniref:Uncharacterized protein n=1 Tax=Vibrio phage Ceto TaxID=2570300 RepID=A0A2H5BGM1_9CAUD|nr:DNA binding protein [Vibrio phage Ceto]AUG85135.1 hypothetical protein CETO_153 [Vibrio phage Ceto]
MNIFVLDLDPKMAAQYHCDKHVISQMKEGVQMLTTALIYWGNKVPLNKSGDPYKKAHENHPCTVWARQGLSNYQWLWDLVYALVEEAEYRFGNTYHIASIMRDGSLPRTPEFHPVPDLRTPFANATADWLKSADTWDDKSTFATLTAIDIYRLYYIVDKMHMTAVEMGEQNIHWQSKHTLGEEFTDYSIWTKRGAPEFMGDRFYRQQCDYFGIKATDLILMGRFPDSEESKKLKAKMYRKLGKKSTGTVASAKAKKTTKADVLVDIRELMGHEGMDCLLKLTLPDLQKVKLALIAMHENQVEYPDMPTGRVKAPYAAAVKQLFNCDADFNKLTLAGLKELLEHFGA